MLLSAKTHNLHVFDIEASDASFAHVSDTYSLKKFTDASVSGRDFLSHPYAKVHAQSHLMQLWGTGTAGEGWVDPHAASYMHPNGGETAYHMSDFSAAIWQHKPAIGVMDEEQAIHSFFSGLNSKILASNKPVALTGWNMVYDVSGLETATYRYGSLKKWRGWMAQQSNKGHLALIDSSENFFEATLKYGKHNPAFASRYHPGITDVAGLKKIQGWGVENVASAMGGEVGAQGVLKGFLPHRANWDAQLTGIVGDRFADLNERLSAGTPFEEAMHASRVIGEGETAEGFFSKVYAGVKQAASAPVEPEVVSLIGKGKQISGRRVATYMGLGLAAVVATNLAFSTRRTRQTQITGLAETGMAADRRHETTDFGSGYRGLDDEKHHLISMRTATVLSGAMALRSAHRYALRNHYDAYTNKLYSFTKAVEERSPYRQFRTFRASEIVSAHLETSHHFSGAQLAENGELTKLGKTFERLSQGQIHIDALDPANLHFIRGANIDGYMGLHGHPGVKFRFTSGGDEGSTMGGAASRHRANLEDLISEPRRVDESAWTFLRRSQNPRSAKSNTYGVEEGFTTAFHPTFAKIGTEEAGFAGRWNRIKSTARNTETVAFETGERFQHLLAQMGIGLRQGSYNKLAHIPFLGSGGLINELLKKRVLPAYLAYTGLKYVDHLLGHHPSHLLASIPLKARVVQAELTDHVPFARRVTDWYKNVVPGGQFGALALPIGGTLFGGMVHAAQVAFGVDRKVLSTLEQAHPWTKSLPKMIREMPRPAVIGAAIGTLLALPFVPGMLGDRKTADERRRIYSGDELVPVRQGRFWEMGPTPWKGGRIKYFRQHWFPAMKAHAEDASLYGSEDEKWAHNPVRHPFKYLRDPYFLEEKNYHDRPYPITSPAFSDVPLVGDLLAATIGRFIKPVVRMHTDEWNPGDDYSLFGKQLDPLSKDKGLAPPVPQDEFRSVGHVLHKELHTFADMVGIPGFTAKSIFEKLFPTEDIGRRTFMEGSRSMTNASRRYYDKEFGAMAGPNPSMDEIEPYGYSEAIRRFIQPDHELKKVNPLRNNMPSWMPGSDYFQNFHEGDPYTKVAEGFARLPGAGYAALNPNVQGMATEDYPTMDKFKILADVAPYSREFSKYRDIVRGLSKESTGTRIDYERTMDQLRQIKESGIEMRKRRFTEETEVIKGTVKSANEYGVMLEEMPGRRFTYSSVGTGAADLSAVAIGENNRLNRDGVTQDVRERQQRLQDFVGQTLSPGTSVNLTVAAGTREHATDAQAVVQIGGLNFNRALIDKHLGQERPDTGGAESKAMYGRVAGLLGGYSEGISFTGDESPLNPTRYIPQPYNSKLWQNRTDISQYEQREMYGTSMRRWHRPIHDFIEPYMQGIVRRVTGKRDIPEEVQFKRDLNTLADTLKYLRGSLTGYTNESKHTSVGANLFAPAELLTSSLSDHEGAYFRSFLGETRTDKRQRVLEDVSPELSRALTAQWVAKDAEVLRGDGKKVPVLGEGGRVFTKSGLESYKRANTQLDYGDYQRSEETAEFFNRTGFRLPDAGSETFADSADYQDIKAKVIQQEGYELHDFNIFNDRASQLWRKPYLDGSARELTAGDTRSTETLRRAVEAMMVSGRSKSPQVRVARHASSTGTGSVKVTVDVDQQGAILKDARRNKEKYQDQAA